MPLGSHRATRSDRVTPSLTSQAANPRAAVAISSYVATASPHRTTARPLSRSGLVKDESIVVSRIVALTSGGRLERIGAINARVHVGPPIFEDVVAEELPRAGLQNSLFDVDVRTHEAL